MATASTHKRGASFERHGFISVLDDNLVAQPLTGWTGESQIRTEAGKFISQCVFEWIDASQAIARISVDDTTQWPICLAHVDIKLTTPTGQIVYTPTGALNIVDQITKAVGP